MTLDAKGEETSSSHALICPYCKHELIDDLTFLEEHGELTECEGCGQKFWARVETSFDYIGSPIEE